MFIETEQTPNPATLKFMPGRDVMGEQGTMSFDDPDATESSPLAASLFDIPHVEAVFLGRDFVTVTKHDDIDWVQVKPQVLGVIMEHFAANRPVILADKSGGDAAGVSTASAEDDEITREIRELIDTRVRPAVAQDGGDIVFQRFEDGVVYLHMRGACAGCPSSTLTLKQGIENMLMHYVPEVQAVEAM
ncbi:MAG: NifU family protein [Alphaproteobacteria bacterium]